MVESRRICLDLMIHSRPVQKFDGKKIYVSTGDSDDMENGELVDFYNRPSRANVQPKINDIIFAKMANTDKTFLIDQNLAKNIFSTGFFVVSSKKIYPKFLYYLIKSDEFDGYKNAYSEGTTQVSISDKRLRQVKLSYETNIEEQKLISEYLDLKIGQIDKLITCLTDQINELQKYQTMKVTETISRGLKNSRLKDSGVKWIGLVPENWEIKKIKYAYKSITKKYENGNFSYIALENIESYTGKFIETISNAGYSLEGTIQANKDDIIFGKLRPYLVKTIVLNEDCCVSSEFAVYRVMKGNIPKFLYYHFISSNYIEVIINSAYGTKMPRANVDFISNLPIAMPSINEQREIVDYLDKKFNEIAKIIDLKKQKIYELNNLKKALIYECVSGKREVF